MSNPITISNIVSEMRGLVKPGETLEHTYELLNGLADRIEAEHKREVEAITAKLEEARHCWKVWSDRADELRTKCDEQYAKIKTAGNGAKIREALECIDSIAKYLEAGTIRDVQHAYRNIQDRVRIALAEPPRNCDKFNDLNSAQRYYIEHGCPKGLGKIVDGEIRKTPWKSRFEKWLFDKERGEADGR